MHSTTYLFIAGWLQVNPLAYRFLTVWNIHAPARECWDALVLRRAWSEWFAPVMLDADTPWSAHVTEYFGAVVRAPYGARLRLRLAVASVRDGQEIVLTCSGDLLGYARVTFTELGPDLGIDPGIDGAACRVEISWHVVANSGLLRWGSVLGLRPVFSWAHNRVMSRALVAIDNNMR